MKEYHSPSAELLAYTAEDILTGSAFAPDPVASSGKEDIASAFGLDWWA